MFMAFTEDLADEDASWRRATGQRGWSYQFIRLVSEGHFGGGQFSEAFEAAQRITYGDPDSWWREWSDLGDRLVGMAREAEARQAPVTASARYLRAGNYYRTAEFWEPYTGQRRIETYRAAVAAFRRGFELGPIRVERVDIPHEDSSLPGYLAISPSAPTTNAPAVVFFGGADTIAEELYFAGHGILQRGVNLLFLDGPGQGGALRENGILSRHDWEVPAGAAFDVLARDPRVASDRIAIMALSLGGYFALRAASMDPRFAACVSWAPHYDVSEFWAARPDDHPLAGQYLWFLGEQDMAGVRRRLADYTLDGLLDRIEMPTLVVIGDGEGGVREDMARRVYDELTCDKTWMQFTRDFPGYEHCQMDNLTVANEDIGDWIAAHL